MKRHLFITAALLLATLQFLLYPLAFDRKRKIDQQAQVQVVLPSSFTQIAVLDFKGLAADFQLLQAIFFIGEKMEHQEKITISDWQYFKRIIDAVTELDPYFKDPYYFAGALLAWGPHMYEDALEILDKGLRNRKDDFHIPFVMSFIHFYFLNDPQKGAEYLKIAADRPGAPKLFFTKLASRLAYYAGSYEFSLSLLQAMIKEEKSEAIRTLLTRRMEALQGAILLEKAVNTYKQKFGEPPQKIKELIEKKIIDELPLEPYGGQWVILKNNRIFSTSKFADRHQ